MSMTLTENRVTSIGYEKAGCGRCAGSGYFGPVSIDSGRCFDCRGTGLTLTRNGRAAKARVDHYAETHMIVPASSLVVGQRIIRDRKVRVVAEVVTTLGKGNGRSREGVEGTDGFRETWTYGQTVVRTKHTSWSGPAHMGVQLSWTPEHLAAAADLVARMSGAIVTRA